MRMASILLVLSLLVLPVTLEAQRGGRGGGGRGGFGGQGRGQRGPENVLLPRAESAAEFRAAEAIDAEESLLNRLTMSDAFMTEYPESELTHQILLVRLQTYVALENNQGILASGDAYANRENAFFDSKVASIEDPEELEGYPQFRIDHFNNLTFAYQSMMNASSGLGRADDTALYGDLAFDAANETWTNQMQAMEEGSPEYQEADQRQLQARNFFLQTVMSAYQNANDAEKTIEYAERSLRLDPQNLATLLTISSVMAERPPEDESEHEDHFDSAEEYAEEALEVLENFLDAAGGQIGADQRANLLSGAYFTLGTVFLNQEEWGDAQDSFEDSLELVPTDAVAHLRLGMAYARDEEAEDAMESLARSVYLNGPEQAREMLEQIYETRNDDLTGLDAFVQSQGEEIGR